MGPADTDRPPQYINSMLRWPIPCWISPNLVWFIGLRREKITNGYVENWTEITQAALSTFCYLFLYNLFKALFVGRTPFFSSFFNSTICKPLKKQVKTRRFAFLTIFLLEHICKKPIFAPKVFPPFQYWLRGLFLTNNQMRITIELQTYHKAMPEATRRR